MDDLSLVEYMNAQLLDTVAQLELAKTQIEERSRELKHLADHDQLTNALTRRAFLQRAQQIFLQAVNQGAKMSCMMVDIDHFKSVNDGYGHLVGDQVIHRLALTLRENVGSQDLVCRYGGEEFCVLVRGDVEQARVIAEKLRTVVESTCGPAVIPQASALLLWSRVPVRWPKSSSRPIKPSISPSPLAATACAPMLR
jgi:diguanylate cyclase (GGDEF)-like protein